MVKPLYPLSDISPDKRKKIKDAQKAKKAYIISLCKNPYLISIALVIIIFVIVIIIHSSRSRKVIDTSVSATRRKENSFNWSLSGAFKNEKAKDIGTTQQEQLKNMGIDENAESFEVKVDTKNLREQRKLLAMRKYEASRQTAERRAREKEEHRQKLTSNRSLRLKEAVMAAQDSNMLGIMKLESFLDEARYSGGDSSDADLYIIAYEQLAKVYQKNNREEKAKEAYLNAFKLMKSQAPDSQRSDWDNAIGNIEQIRAKPTR